MTFGLYSNNSPLNEQPTEAPPIAHNTTDLTTFHQVFCVPIQTQYDAAFHLQITLIYAGKLEFGKWSFMITHDALPGSWSRACPGNVLYNIFTWAYVNFKCFIFFNRDH